MAARAVLVVLALGSIVACNHVDDIFCTPGVDCARDAGPDPLPEIPDVGPFMHQDACVACVQDACSRQWDTCMSDPTCLREYDCHGEATDPGQHLICQSTDRAERAQVFSTTGDQPPTLWEAVISCADRACEDACALGRDFACVGKWDLPAIDGDQVEVIVGAYNLVAGPVAEMEVSGCDTNDIDCSRPLGRMRTTEGRMTLSLPANDASGFDGAIRYDILSQEDLPELERVPTTYYWPSMPWQGREWAGVLLFAHQEAVTRWEAVAGDAEVDPSRPVIVLALDDCAGQRAPGLRIETEADCSPFRCDYYWVGFGPDPALTQTVRDSAASVSISPLSNTIPDLRIVHADTGRVVGRFLRRAPAGSHVHAWAVPLTRGEQHVLDSAEPAGDR